jgi:conjugal transfer pilus assembly protein TraV
MTSKPLAPILFAIVVSGCASSMSGVGGSERYGCQAPPGVQCTSVSGVYANTLQGGPRQAAQPPAARERVARPNAGAAPAVARPIQPSTSSVNTLRSNPRVLRVWIAPWEDSDGDLNEDAVVHVIVDTGRWLIEHVRPTSGHRVDAVAPPLAGAAEGASRPAEDSAAVAPERLPRQAGARASSAEPNPDAR